MKSYTKKYFIILAIVTIHSTIKTAFLAHQAPSLETILSQYENYKTQYQHSIALPGYSNARVSYNPILARDSFYEQQKEKLDAVKFQQEKEEGNRYSIYDSWFASFHKPSGPMRNPLNLTSRTIAKLKEFNPDIDITKKISQADLARAHQAILQEEQERLQNEAREFEKDLLIKQHRFAVENIAQYINNYYEIDIRNKIEAMLQALNNDQSLTLQNERDENGQNILTVHTDTVNLQKSALQNFINLHKNILRNTPIRNVKEKLIELLNEELAHIPDVKEAMKDFYTRMLQTNERNYVDSLDSGFNIIEEPITGAGGGATGNQ